MAERPTIHPETEMISYLFFTPHRLSSENMNEIIKKTGGFITWIGAGCDGAATSRYMPYRFEYSLFCFREIPPSVRYDLKSLEIEMDIPGTVRSEFSHADTERPAFLRKVMEKDSKLEMQQLERNRQWFISNFPIV
jgi:hypothetical protein